jgi:hypothetical protein
MGQPDTGTGQDRKELTRIVKGRLQEKRWTHFIINLLKRE